MHKAKLVIMLTAVLTWQVSTTVADVVSDRITVTVRGKGPEVVFIPGLASSSAVWDATASHLENHFRLHVIQVAGFAGSPPRANAQGAVIQPTVDAIDAYIKTNKLKTPKVIGHSLGGLMGCLLAIQNPEDVGSLMIVDSLPFYGVLFGAKDVASVVPQAAVMRDRILGQTQEEYARSEAAFMRSLVKSAEECKKATQWAIESDKSVVARAMYEDATTDVRPQLKQVKTSVTILHAWDSLTSVQRAASDQLYQENYSTLPNKKIVRIDSSFHFIMLDQPDAFAAQVDAFLK